MVWLCRSRYASLPILPDAGGVTRRFTKSRSSGFEVLEPDMNKERLINRVEVRELLGLVTPAVWCPARCRAEHATVSWCTLSTHNRAEPDWTCISYIQNLLISGSCLHFEVIYIYVCIPVLTHILHVNYINTSHIRSDCPHIIPILMPTDKDGATF